MSNPKIEANRGHGTKGGQFGFARDAADAATADNRAGALDVADTPEWSEGMTAVTVAKTGATQFIESEASTGTDSGTFGDYQIGNEASFRTVAPLEDGTFLVITETWGLEGRYEDDDASNPLEDIVTVHCSELATCTDPDDPGGTEINTDYEYNQDFGGGMELTIQRGEETEYDDAGEKITVYESDEDWQARYQEQIDKGAERVRRRTQQLMADHAVIANGSPGVSP